VLTWEDGQALMRTCPSVSVATPIVQQFGEVKFGEERSQYQIVGVQPVFQDVRNYYVEVGRFFSALDDTARTNACVIGHGVLKDLKLPTTDRTGPPGRGTELQHHRRDGTQGGAPGSGAGQVRDDPLRHGRQPVGAGRRENTVLLVRSKTPELVDRASDEIENSLRVRHRLRSDQPSDFKVGPRRSS